MKRKITCMLLAVLMIVSLLPLGASAASNLRASENVINLIKQFEGFSASAFWDVSQWTIGYGTTGSAGQTISEAEADLVLRSQLSAIDEKINQFTARNNLYLTQYQHDALVSFSFNCGTDWMTQGGRFFDAVTRNGSVNEFLFAISLWANAGSTPDSGLLNRRMAEANLYLNAVYSKAAPAAYTFVILDPNGGTPGNGGADKMQGYLSGSNVSILAANPTKAGVTFGGWFTAATGGTSVKYLNASTAGRTLYAQYGVACTVTSAYATIRNGAGTNYTQIASISAGTQIVILETASVNGIQWGRIADGWISLEYTNYNGQSVVPSGSSTVVPGTSTTGNATVSASAGVNIRSGAGMNYSIVGSAYNGQRINVVETANNNGTLWGRIGTNQWICMTYVRLDSSSSAGTTNNTGIIWNDNNGETTHNSSATVFNGVVTATGVNVRSGAGTNNPVVCILNRGTRVTVTQQITKDNIAWGQIAQGWVCMNYIALEANSMNTNNTGTSTTGVIATGTVRSNTNLNVRTGPGTGYPRVNSLLPGAVVNIYERTTVNGMEWGRIGDNQWVCMAYINLTSTTTVTPSTSTTVVTTTGTMTGTVNSTTNLNVRSGPGTNYGKVGALSRGTRVTVYETASVNGALWGRIGTNQWICLSYVALDNGSTTVTPSSSGTTTGTITGRVSSTGKLNIRAGAGTNTAVVGGLASGTVVTITEVVNVNGSSWGHIANGWVSMNYIQITSGSTGNVIWN